MALYIITPDAEAEPRWVTIEETDDFRTDPILHRDDVHAVSVDGELRGYVRRSHLGDCWVALVAGQRHWWAAEGATVADVAEVLTARDERN